MSDDPSEPTKREGPRKAWMAPTVGADSVAPPPRETQPLPMATSVFDPPEQRFVEKSELGRGGMGRVVEAVDRALGRPVAIKQSLATQAVDLARFEREVRITAQLQHPSVIPILDVGRDPDGQPFYIMRKIEGEPLADRVAQAATVRDRLALVSSFLNAVDAAAYAHARRIIHRDIKPWNILLGPFGETLLIDWGIARELDGAPDDSDTLGAAETGTALTRLGVAQGTPGFLSPEQARGEVVDARADVYSLGATLYYVLSNKLPYGRVAATAAIDLAAAGKPPDFAVIPEEVPRELLAILTKAMAPDPAHRYADAGELATDLRRFLSGQLVAAHDYSAGERIARWVRRHRIAVTVGTLAVITVAVVSTISIRQVIRDRDAARQASALAVERGDDQLLDRARVLAITDPTSALATLRELRTDSPRWDIARTIMRSAVMGGIERRIAHHDDFIRATAFSPDGSSIVSSGSRLELYNLAARTTRQLAALAPTSLRWRDDRTVVYLADGVAGTIDIETDAIHRFPMKAVQIEPAGGRVLVRTEDGAVIAVASDRTEETLFESGAVDLAVRGTQIAILSRSAIAILDGASRKDIPLDVAAGQGSVRLSPDGKRVAALIGTVAREWHLDRDEPPQQWPSLGEIQYAGGTLYGRNRLGFFSLEGPSPAPRLTLRDQDISLLGAHIIPFTDGAVLLSDRSELAYVTPAGVRQFPHRSIAVKGAAVSRDGMRIALSSERDVLVIDLELALPRAFPMSSTTELFGATTSHALVRMTPRLADNGRFTAGLVLVDLATQQQRQLDPQPMPGFAVDDLFGAQPQVGSVRLWDSAGRRVFAHDQVANFTFDDRTVVFADRDGAIWREPIGGQRVRIGALPPSIKAVTETGMSAVRAIVMLEGEPILNVYDKETTRFFRASGEEVKPGIPGFAPNLYGGRDGVWYGIDFGSGTVWRSQGGVAHQIPFEHDPGALQVRRDHIMVITKDSVVCELDLDGKVVRTFATPGATPQPAGESYYVVTTRGVDLIGRTGARGTVQLPGDVMTAKVAGKRVVALGNTRAGKQLFVWTDPVPDDLAALPDYLRRLTNARLPTGSDALTWEN